MTTNTQKYLIQTSPSTFFKKKQKIQQKLNIKYFTQEDIVNRLQLILLSLKQQENKIKKFYQDKVQSLKTQLCLKQLQINQITNENDSLKKQNMFLKQKVQKYQNHKQILLKYRNLQYLDYNSYSQLPNINQSLYLSQSQQIFYHNHIHQPNKKSISHIQEKKQLFHQSNEQRQNKTTENYNSGKSKLHSFLMPLQLSSISVNIQQQKDKYIIPQNSFEILNKMNKLITKTNKNDKKSKKNAKEQ